MTIREFAKRLEISERTAYAMVADGAVAHMRIGRRDKEGTIRITEEGYQEYIKSVTVPARTKPPIR